MKYLIILLLLLGCTKAEYKVDPMLEPYVQLFLHEAYSRGVDLIINDMAVEFGDTGGTSGRCWYRCYERHPVIMISKSIWPNLSNTEKEILMFHELGHCALGQRHRYNSIMHPSFNVVDSEYNYTSNRSTLLDELFSFSF